ncbi:hypothetical protein BDC45DRAFT_129844 [Circinella umbellata]|nr:hypothetical protein BDC45DRAFT_129844 [Circinella umbellata]
MQQNFKDDNVVESFFKKGAYAANQKERAEQDFIQAVIHCGDAKNEMNEDVFNWANDMIIKDRFRCLDGYEEFWGSLAIVEKVVEKVGRSALKSAIPCSSQPQESIRRSPIKRKSPVTYADSGRKPRKLTEKKKSEDHSEVDSMVSLRIFLNERSQCEPENDKEAYFKSLNENGVMDVSDRSAGSQMAALTPNSVVFIESNFISDQPQSLSATTTAVTSRERFKSLGTVLVRKSFLFLFILFVA